MTHTPQILCRAAVLLGFVLSALAAAQAATPAGAPASSGSTPKPGEGYVSLIDQGGFTPSRAYRILPFVEFQQVGTDDKVELSTPFVPANATKTVAGTQVYEWSRFQDRVKYASTVGLNNSLVPGPGSPEDLYLTNCVLQLPADLSIAIKQGISGTSNLVLGKPDIEVSDTSNGGALLYDNVDLYGFNKKDASEHLPTFTPRIPREEYCKDSSLNPVPDVPFIYIPGVQTCAFGGCLGTWNYPSPLYVNWPALSARMQAACTSASQSYTDVYVKNITDALVKNMPLAVSWDGFLNVHTQNGKPTSGVVMTPVIGETTVLPSAAKIAQKDPRFAAYFAIPFKTITTGFVPGVGQTANTAGISALEDLKRGLAPGTLAEQEEHGYTTLFQTWTSLDAVVDYRPTIFWASSVTCYLFGPCIPAPLPLTAPDVLSTGPACTVPNAGSQGAGTTTLTDARFHHAYVSVPESYPIPNLSGDPQRSAPLRLPGQD